MLLFEITPCNGQDCNTQEAAQTEPKADPHAAGEVDKPYVQAMKEWEREIVAEAEKLAVKPNKPGKRERETVFRTVTILEKELAKLPKAQAQVAGYLMAHGVKGDTSAERNALAVYLRDKVREHLSWEIAFRDPFQDVKLWFEVNGTIIESPTYQMALNPEPWQEMFMLRLRQGDFPELLTS